MTHKQFIRQLGLYHLFPQPVLSRAMRISEPMTSEQRSGLLSLLEKQYAFFKKHAALKDRCIDACTSAIESISESES